MKSKFEKVALVALLVVIIGYIYYVFYLKSELSKINSTLQTAKKYQQKYDTLNKRKSTIDNELKTMVYKSDIANQAIPEKYDKKEIIMYFYNQLKQNNLKSDRISLGETNNKSYTTGTASFKVEGENFDINNLMRTIENDKRKFVIKQASVNASEKGVYSGTLKIEFYALK